MLMRAWLGIAAFCLFSPLVAASASFAADYGLDGTTLRQKLPASAAGLYSCNPSPEFVDATLCGLSDNGSAGDASAADAVITSADGSILYASHRSEVSRDFDEVVTATISELTKSRGGAIPKYITKDSYVFAIWGDTRLEEIATNATEYDELTGLVEQNYGLLVAPASDLDAAKASYQPVYRVIGGDGLVAIISHDDSGQVTIQKIVVAAGSLAEANFEAQARLFLASDQEQPKGSLARWPEVAFMTRRLALNTTPELANAVVDRVFASEADVKYRSHVWAYLPTSVIKHLRDGTYQAVDIFGAATEFPDIRDGIAAQLKAEPNEPYSEFLLYTLGRFDEAVAFNANSPIGMVLSYARAHSNLRQALATAFAEVAKAGDLEILKDEISSYSYKYEAYFEAPYEEETVDERNEILSENDFFNGYAYPQISESRDNYKDNQPSVSQYINYFNQFPENFGSKPLAFKLADFRKLTDPLMPQFEDVLRDKNSPHYDDATYILAWLTYHRGDVVEALDRFGNAVALIPPLDADGSYGSDVERFDYAFAALHQLTRIFRTLPAQDVVARVDGSDVLAAESIVWVAALGTLYHAHEYALVMAEARKALRHFDIVAENLPVTTHPQRIDDALTGLNLGGDWYLQDIVYLYQSSHEISEALGMLSRINEYPAAVAQKTIRELIVKYALTKEADRELMWSDDASPPRHKDLRQSIYIAGYALQSLPRTTEYSKFREWLHYKRVTLLSQFDPVAVAAANAEFRREFRQSLLLDDTLAEQVFAEAVTIGDMAKATETFDELRQNYPSSNALDNAYSWMAIGWTCVGQPEKAREIDQQIVQLFPQTRHARYAEERLQAPAACSALQQLYNWDYAAMGWRERNRLDALQALIEQKVDPYSPPPAGQQEALAPPQVQSADDAASAPASDLTRVQAVELVSNLFQLSMLPPTEAVEKLKPYYAANVEYYGKTSTRGEVLQDKRGYFDRWPARDYRLQYDTIEADCSQDQECKVTGDYDWSVISPKRKKRSTGTASFEYVVSAKMPYLVLEETGKVIRPQ